MKGMVITMDDKLAKIYGHLKEKDFTSCTKEACAQIEVLLRNQIKKNLSLLSKSTRLQISKLELEVGKGQKGIEDFTMGEIVGLYRNAGFLDDYSMVFKKDITPIKMYNLGHVVEIRNQLTHAKEDAPECSEEAAKTVVGLLELLVQIFESEAYGIEHLVKNGTLITADNKATFDKSSAKYLSALDNAINLFVGEGKPKLRIVDLGCRDGSLTLCNYLRYTDYIDKVYAISESEQLYLKAKEKLKDYDNIVTKYIEFDDNLYDSLAEFLEDMEEETVDIIYSDGRYRQIKDSEAFFRKIRRQLLSDEGGIILKAFDDGSKICYPDPDNLLQKIIDKTASLSIVSDRFNGRKVYSHYWKAGFRNIRSFYIINDTIGLSCDERMDLYEESFDYRINYFKKLLDNEPSNTVLKKEYKEMKANLEKLQDSFCDDSFYYAETNYILVARK